MNRFITANIATYSKRKHTIDKVITTLINQVDLVRVYYNDYRPEPRKDIKQIIGKDITDRGKFSHIDINEIAFTCDDDIIYPPDYVKETLEKLTLYPDHVLTYHGRKLKGKGLNYYQDHKSHSCLLPLSIDTDIDIPGTGVMCFDTNIIIPELMEYDRMADILMGISCKQKNIPIKILSHKMGWINTINHGETIYHSCAGNCETQSNLIDEYFY